MAARIGVVIPVFNRARQAIDAIECVARQSRPATRLVMVDDGSDPPLAPQVEAWLETDRTELDVLVRTQPNAGAAHARNRGLEVLEHVDYVAFLDSDDLWPEDFLARASERLASDPTAVAATADRVFERGPEGEIVATTSSHDIEADPTGWIFRHSGGIGSATLFRADAIRSLGGYDESVATGHDTALFLRLSLIGHWLHLPGDPVRYRSGTYPAGAEDDHLRFRYRDFRLRWAEVDERFLEEEQGRHTIPPATYRRHMARRWRNAGDQLAAQGDHRGARRCFLRSLRWHPKWKTSRGLIGSIRPSAHDVVGATAP